VGWVLNSPKKKKKKKGLGGGRVGQMKFSVVGEKMRGFVVGGRMIQNADKRKKSLRG